MRVTAIWGRAAAISNEVMRYGRRKRCPLQNVKPGRFALEVRNAVFVHSVNPIRRRLPKGSQGLITVFSALLPGVASWMQIYSMLPDRTSTEDRFFCAMFCAYGPFDDLHHRSSHWWLAGRLNALCDHFDGRVRLRRSSNSVGEGAFVASFAFLSFIYLQDGRGAFSEGNGRRWKVTQSGGIVFFACYF